MGGNGRDGLEHFGSCDPERMVRAALEAHPGIESVCPYGDGQAAEKIVSAIICDAVQRS